MGLGHCGLGTAPMPNENLSGESGHQQPGRGGEQGNKARQETQIFLSESQRKCPFLKEYCPSDGLKYEIKIQVDPRQFYHKMRP